MLVFYHFTGCDPNFALCVNFIQWSSRWNIVVSATQCMDHLHYKKRDNKEIPLFISELSSNHSMIPPSVWPGTYMNDTDLVGSMPYLLDCSSI